MSDKSTTILHDFTGPDGERWRYAVAPDLPVPALIFTGKNVAVIAATGTDGGDLERAELAARGQLPDLCVVDLDAPPVTD